MLYKEILVPMLCAGSHKGGLIIWAVFMRSRGRCSEPLCEEGFVEAGDSAGEHQGVAGEAEPVGFEGPGERSESIAPRAARVISVSPLHRESRDRRLRQRTRTKVVTGNRLFTPGKDDPGEGGDEIEDGFKEVHE